MCECAVSALQRQMLVECQEFLRMLDHARDAEMSKTIGDRSVPMLRFLAAERAVYAFGVSLLTRLQERIGEPTLAGAANERSGVSQP